MNGVVGGLLMGYVTERMRWGDTIVTQYSKAFLSFAIVDSGVCSLLRHRFVIYDRDNFELALFLSKDTHRPCALQRRIIGMGTN